MSKDEYEMKMMGLQMNEEIFTRKFKWELQKYMEDVHGLIEKERQLETREKQLSQKEQSSTPVSRKTSQAPPREKRDSSLNSAKKQATPQHRE